ncbi:MAG: translocation/assembly module TamB domain-containing protein, partial [Bacteroidales bacterium]
ISVQSTSVTDNFTLFLRSSFANATYRGSDFFTHFIDKFLNITLQSNLHAIFPKNKDYIAANNSRYSFLVEFNDSRSISEFILPGLFIAEGSFLNVQIDEEENLSLNLKSSELGFGNNYSNNLSLSLEGDISEINAIISSNIIHFAGLNLDSNRVHLNLKDNYLKIKSEYTNRGYLENRLDFLSDILFTKSNKNDSLVTDITIYPSELYLNGEHWKLANSKIVNQGSTFVFHDLDLFSDKQHLNVNGIISSSPLDTLSITLQEIDISPINSFIKDSLDLKGKITGTIYAADLYKEPQIVATVFVDEAQMYGHQIGNLLLKSNWNNIDKVFDINILNTLEERTPFIVSGTFHPRSNYLNLNASLDNMSVSYFEPFLIDIISKTDGSITGTLSLKGPLDKLNLTSNSAMLNNFSFLVDFTKVRYTLSGPLLLTQDGINLNNVAIRDRFGNGGRIYGGLSYKYFRDLKLNTTIQFRNLEALNTTEIDNSDFYGTAYGTGQISISGPLKKILMDITVTTNRNTSIHIPLSAATEASGNNLLTFVEPYSEVYGQNGNRKENLLPPQGTDLQVKLKANVTPDAAMLIEIDKTVGDVITGYGSGLISLDIDPSKDIFSIHGDYIIHSGSYKFVLQGFIERDFTIEPGGNIGFNGDILKTNLNLTANYKTKAAINTLISDTSSVATRRTVDCRIDMTGQLMNPRLGFGIDIPDIDPLTKSRVNAALNTEDKVVRQVMSLLVSGSFIPDVQSTIVNNSTILYSNATEVLSNQINKIFNQLEIPLDLSFNYQPGQNGRDLFDAAVSAQLFNNRVVVNGNIGSAKYMDKSGDVVGDLDVEVKLDDKGRFRAKAFSHSADQYSNYLDNSQRNGIGLVYQEEFSSFKELIKSLFTSKKKRARQLEKQKAVIKPREDNLLPLPKVTIEGPLIKYPQK